MCPTRFSGQQWCRDISKIGCALLDDELVDDDVETGFEPQLVEHQVNPIESERGFISQ
jgi:hypothetical protein